MKKGLKIFLGVTIILLFSTLYLIKNLSLTIRIFGVATGLLVFYLIDYFSNAKFRKSHYVIILIVLLFGILFSPLYSLSPNYDKVLHFFLPFLAGFVAFHLIKKKIRNKNWQILTTILIVISFLALHEMGEYLLDVLWDLKLQGVYLRDTTGLDKFNLVLPKNDDTMIDMLMGTAGIFIFSIYKWIELKINYH